MTPKMVAAMARTASFSDSCPAAMRIISTGSAALTGESASRRGRTGVPSPARRMVVSWVVVN